MRSAGCKDVQACSLLLRLDHDSHREPFCRAAQHQPADGGRILRIKARAKPDILIIRANLVGHIEAYPTKSGNMDFSPGMAGLIRRYLVSGVEIS